MTERSNHAPSESAGTIFYWLLFWLVLAAVVAPQFESLGPLLERLCLTFVLIVAVLANRRRRLLFYLGLAVAVVAAPLLWGSMVVDSNGVSLSHYLVLIIFFAFNAGALLVAVLRDHTANPRAIAGIVCVYLLLGLTWACAYSAIEYIEADPFSAPNHRQLDTASVDRPETPFSQYVYFSFVTMSTLGYGDIAPRTTLAETATWLQSVVGQFFIAVLVARFINTLPRPQPIRQAS
jgi:voltage-gated potassium channel